MNLDMRKDVILFGVEGDGDSLELMMVDKITIYEDLIKVIESMCHTCITKLEYSRVDLGETINRLIRDAKAKL
jgi:hypothetical protein